MPSNIKKKRNCMILDKNFYPIPQLNTNMHTSKPFQTDNIVNQAHAHLFDKYSKNPLNIPFTYSSANMTYSVQAQQSHLALWDSLAWWKCIGWSFVGLLSLTCCTNHFPKVCYIRSIAVYILISWVQFLWRPVLVSAVQVFFTSSTWLHVADRVLTIMPWYGS